MNENPRPPESDKEKEEWDVQLPEPEGDDPGEEDE